MDSSSQNKNSQLPQKAKQIIWDWIRRHRNPYPSKEEMKELARLGGIHAEQVNQFFTNARRRQLKADPSIIGSLIDETTEPEIVLPSQEASADELAAAEALLALCQPFRESQKRTGFTAKNTPARPTGRSTEICTIGLYFNRTQFGLDPPQGDLSNGMAPDDDDILAEVLTVNKNTYLSRLKHVHSSRHEKWKHRH
ncbi:hypothetical protein CAPTEDRAFT_218681 [Capitella teleta]|uniref:Homeobox domain-containing protein n=1 Tax=Capitella teleta TaxID=283909 RepID=R7VHW9_CAPTE|nr:hypothetical protein CAPTEDRAFT_218681 [Capitella teleta]|eukprot:ELU18157.1 hypothetical protein CAPTEDRAFT_218681 [Capitella teleta]